MQYRKCSKCYREKPYYEFYKDRDKYCIYCAKKEIEIQKLLNELVKEDKQ